MDANTHIDTSNHAPGSAYGDLLAEVGAMFDDVVEKATIKAKTDVDRANARMLVLTDELDRRRATETAYALSTTSWLQAMCQMTGREASGTVKTARSLVHMPSVAEKAVADAECDARGRELYFNQTYGGRWDMQAEFGVADGQVIVLPQLVGGDVEERDRGGNRFVPLSSNLCLDTCKVSGSSWPPSDLAALGHLPHCVREERNPTSSTGPKEARPTSPTPNSCAENTTPKPTESTPPEP